jgi:hypothetical protein
MRSKIKRKEVLPRSLPRTEHEIITSRLQLEIADLKTKLTETRAREAKLSETLNMIM